jgi:hypothetical protein
MREYKEIQENPTAISGGFRSETARGQENQIDRMSVRSAAGKAAEPTPSKCKAPWRIRCLSLVGCTREERT